MSYNFQIHKYKNGHQLVATTLQLDRIDQDTVDRLSDISGQLRPGEVFEPYFTCYPLPSERYFVVARTWQDLTATRAGCVLTKSIVILMKEWEETTVVNTIFNILKKATFDVSFPSSAIAEPSNAIPSVSEAPIEELVEALFLEQRKPIVIFDCKDRVEIITRLYTVFWPTIRSKFAACTFALAPRSISNRPFDLLFSDSNMRTRFSDWIGRRIEGAPNSRKFARHRWTKDLTDRVFKSCEPSMYDKNAASFFTFIDKGDESTLRLSLLWDELLVKAKYKSSPMAILGLLDIINSQTVFAEALYKNLEPQIRRAINDALNTLEPNEAWKFYAGLLVKHKRKLMGREMLFEVKSACTLLTLSAPGKAIAFISTFNPSLERIPSILYASIGNGLAQHVTKHTITLIVEISPELGLLLLATSRDLASAMMTLIQNGQEQLNNPIEKYLGISDKKSVQRAKNNLMHYIQTPAHKRITSLLLNKVSFDQYQRVLFVIAENTLFNYREFDDILLKSTLEFNAPRYLVDLLINYSKRGRGEVLLIKLLQSQPELIRDYFFDVRTPALTRNKIIVEVITGLVYESLALLASDKNLTLELLPVLTSEKKFDKEKLAEFILLADLPVVEALSIFRKLPASVINSVSFDRLVALIKKGYLAVGPSPLIITVLSKLNEIQAGKLVASLLDVHSDNSQINLIFESLLASGNNMKNILSRNIDTVSEILSKNLPNKISAEVADGWASIVGLSNDKEKQRKAAVSMLGYAFKCDNGDPTSLILTAFPIVYDNFSNGRTMTQTIAYWVFSDWDKCKTLRQDLVDRYLDSNWPQSGIFQVAKKTGILKDIISIFSDSKQGKKYMESALNDLEESSTTIDKATIKQLKKNIKPNRH